VRVVILERLRELKAKTRCGLRPKDSQAPDGKDVWVVVRGENYVAVLDGTTYEEKTRIAVANGPGMTIFSPDGKYGYVCSSFTPETAVITIADHKIVGKVAQASPFCPNIAATPDGKQVWFTLKDTGRTQVFDAQPPFSLLKTLDTGPITNHGGRIKAMGHYATKVVRLQPIAHLMFLLCLFSLGFVDRGRTRSRICAISISVACGHDGIRCSAARPPITCLAICSTA
jgi:hypothetical protein